MAFHSRIPSTIVFTFAYPSSDRAIVTFADRNPYGQTVMISVLREAGRRWRF